MLLNAGSSEPRERTHARGGVRSITCKYAQLCRDAVFQEEYYTVLYCASIARLQEALHRLQAGGPGTHRQLQAQHPLHQVRASHQLCDAVLHL